MRRIALTLVILSTACISTPDEERLSRTVEEILANSQVTRAGIAYYDLGSGDQWFRNENEIFHAASTMKVPVMMAIFEAVERGELSLDQPVPIVNEFRSIYDGSIFASGAEEDSDPELYEYTGRSLPLRELVRRMVVRSSNLATNVLIEYVGARRVTELIRETGTERMEVLRGVQDLKAYEAGMSNTATAHDLMVILRHLARSAAEQQDGPADTMIEILSHQEFNEGIPAGLPPGTLVAHKTGSITSIYHDAAIIYPGDVSPYVLVILTGGTDDEEASRVVSEISELFWKVHHQ